MPESAEELYARVVAMVGADGHLPLPDIASSTSFPWEGDLRTRTLLPPVDVEPPRDGEGSGSCARCADPEADAIWRNERWLVSATSAPTGLPLRLVLHPWEHMDVLDMDDDLAGEHGRICSNLHRILHYLPNVGSVQRCTGDHEVAHLETWFTATTARLPQIAGPHAADWERVLPPGPEDLWRADLHEVARKLANHDGRALV